MQSNSSSSSLVPKIIGVIVAILVCCSCVLILGAGAYVYMASRQQTPIDFPSPPPTNDSSTPLPVPTLNKPPADSISPETIETLNQTLIPENDPYELACRLQGICNVPKTVDSPLRTVGDKDKFWILNSDTNENFQIDATLLYVTPHVYFWAEDGANVNKSDMKALIDTFENKIYAKDREFFGSEWTPGVDNDPHIYVIYAGNIGSHVAGFFNSSDEYNPLVKEYSNGHETYVLSTTQDLGVEYTYATLAHEFVHMIQFPADRNDVSWINEGFAEVGAFLNGYDVGGWDFAYSESPDLQLTDWLGSTGENGPHYGQSFLYLTYFLDRFGEEATKALTKNPENDLPSVDNTLASLNITDPQTGKIVTADDLFMDWATALYLKDPNVGDGRFTYHNYPNSPQTTDTDVISDCPSSALDRSVNQYGVDYIKVNCTGDLTLQFSGSTVAGLLPTDAHSGKYAFWSNKGNESDMTLTREFDFTTVNGPVTLSYSMWYDLETDYDYVFLETSTDGKNWQILTTPSGTGNDPSGNSFGWGYNAQSGDWIQEDIDLSQFAGKKVQIRFEYITDAAVNGEGFLLDDVKVDAINYFTDFEADDGGWTANGFARVENVLPQTYRLDLIIKGDTTTVTPVELNADNTADIPLSLKAGEEAVLVVTGTTRFTRIPAAYQIEVK